jgi:hypothetical protein
MKLLMRFHIPNHDICQTDRQDGHKGRTAVEVKKAFLTYM